MKSLVQSFLKLTAVYHSKREKFKKALERMKRKGQLDLYQKGSALLEKVENSLHELKGELSLNSYGASDGQVNAVLRSKFKSLKKAYKELNEITKPELQQWIEAVVTALFLAVILRNFIFGLYHVPTGSAEPNILVGDRIWGNKMAYYISDVKHGDLVIFDNPEFPYDSNSIKWFWQKYVGFAIPLLGLPGGPDNWVKRVIAIPGDTIEGRIEDNKTVLYRNGLKVEEPYVNPYPLIRVHKSIGFIPFDHVGPLTIPSFLRKQNNVERNYTYDPSKPFSEQPFYNMTEEEVVRKKNGDLFLSQPYSPTYRVLQDLSQINSLADIQSLMAFSGEDQLLYTIDKFGPIIVPDGKYWAMGDNRKGSYDARFWGFLDKSLIHGRASFVIYSIDSEEAFWLFDVIKNPITFFTKYIRWNRFFKNLTSFNGKTEHEQKGIIS